MTKCPITSQAVVLIDVLDFAADGSPITAIRSSGCGQSGRIASHCVRLIQTDGALRFSKDTRSGRVFIVITELETIFVVTTLGPEKTAASDLAAQLADEAEAVINGRKPLLPAEPPP